MESALAELARRELADGSLTSWKQSAPMNELHRLPLTLRAELKL
jgi:hypothetical protein